MHILETTRARGLRGDVLRRARAGGAMTPMPVVKVR